MYHERLCTTGKVTDKNKLGKKRRLTGADMEECGRPVPLGGRRNYMYTVRGGVEMEREAREYMKIQAERGTKRSDVLCLFVWFLNVLVNN